MTAKPEFTIKQSLFGRWIIAHGEDERYAWSGSRWVPINGDVQVCNFTTAEEAGRYVESWIGHLRAAKAPTELPRGGCGKPGHVTAGSDEGTQRCATCVAEQHRELDPRKYCHLCGRQWHPHNFCTCKTRIESVHSIIEALRDYYGRQTSDPYLLQELTRVLTELGPSEHRASVHIPQVPGQFTEGDPGLPQEWRKLFADNTEVWAAMKKLGIREMQQCPGCGQLWVNLNDEHCRKCGALMVHVVKNTDKRVH